jgi:hypothetical protein
MNETVAVNRAIQLYGGEHNLPHNKSYLVWNDESVSGSSGYSSTT